MEGLGNYSFIIMIVFFGVIMYFLIIRPQRKREKQQKELRNSIEVGDEVTTIGGIIGRVVSIKDDTFIIETGNDRSHLRFRRWAIQDVAKLSMEGEGEEKKDTTSSDSDGGGIESGKNDK